MFLFSCLYLRCLFCCFSCFFDGIKGKVGNLFFTTITLSIVFSADTILYALSWVRIYKQDREIKRTVGKTDLSAPSRAARSMLLFVFAFFIQWWPNFVFGLWSLKDSEIPQALFHIMVVFANLGGVFNLVVYVIIRRRQLRFSTRHPEAGDQGDAENIPDKASSSSGYISGHVVSSTGPSSDRAELTLP